METWGDLVVRERVYAQGREAVGLQSYRAEVCGVLSFESMVLGPGLGF